MCQITPYKICNVLTDIFNFDIIFFDKNEFFKSNKAVKNNNKKSNLRTFEGLEIQRENKKMIILLKIYQQKNAVTYTY